MAVRKNVEAVVSAMGILLDIVVNLVAMLKAKGANIGEAFYKLGTKEGKKTLEQIAELIVQAGKPVQEPVVKVTNLLRHLTTVSVSAREKFVAEDHFIMDTSASAKIRIGYLGDNFKKFFLGKTEENILACELTVRALERDSLDADIRRELTPEREETALAHFYELLSKQPKGEDGTLLTNGNWNIFYIKDTNGKLWAVHAVWDSSYGGWYVRALSVEYLYGWSAGHRVFSR